MTKFINQKGQAALMDSIFFLTIVSLICTTLFYFAINYGLQTDQQINSFYAKDFSTDALKVITYINVIRDGNSIDEVISSGEPFENDYLFALIKEDYADKKVMSSSTTRAITRTLDSVMKPFDPSIDYAFFALEESTEQYLFLLLATHQCLNATLDSDGDGVPNCYDIDAPFGQKEIGRAYFYCLPTTKDVLEKQIFVDIGKVNTALGKVTLSESTNSESQGKPFIIGLSEWVVEDIDVLREDNLTINPDFNCIEINLN